MLSTGEDKNDKTRLSEELTPEQDQRLKTAVRLVVNYLLDKSSLNRKNGTRRTPKRSQATVPKPEQLRLDI